MTGVAAGKEFGRLKVLRFAYRHASSRQAVWECVCACGKSCLVRQCNLTSGVVTSCGCSRRTHGHTKGGKQTTTYRVWANMILRCTNKRVKDFERYGGRGIRVCHRWRTFANFLADMGERPGKLTLERVNNEGDYCPENCKWATTHEQAVNKRPRKKRKVETVTV